VRPVLTVFSEQVLDVLRHCTRQQRRDALDCMREVERTPSVGRATRLTVAEPGDLVHRCDVLRWQLVYSVRDGVLRLRILERLEPL
jgi:hypothetical protein